MIRGKARKAAESSGKARIQLSVRPGANGTAAPSQAVPSRPKKHAIVSRGRFPTVQKQGSFHAKESSSEGDPHSPPVPAVPPSQGPSILGFVHFKPSQMPSQAVPNLNPPSQGAGECPDFVTHKTLFKTPPILDLRFAICDLGMPIRRRREWDGHAVPARPKPSQKRWNGVSRRQAVSIRAECWTGWTGLTGCGESFLR